MSEYSIKSMFLGNNGKWSMMRILAFIVTVGALPALYFVPEQSTQICGLIAAVNAGKWLQKRSEPSA
jgi:hypothetical protein